MHNLPIGTVTYLMTDIEGSTRLWEEHPDEMRSALARHDVLAAEIIGAHEGILIKSRGEGDSLFAVFGRASQAASAALDLQRALLAVSWPAEIPLRVRMALNTGEVELRDRDYYGAAVNRCARLRAIAHGGQVLLSSATAGLVREELSHGASLRHMGAHRLRDLLQPEPVWQLLHPSLPADFPPLRSLQTLANNLLLQNTTFVGREKEVAEVKDLLNSTRLLTLAGVGGCGKTRLALQVAADILDVFPDGVWLADLAALADPDLVAQKVAGAVGVREEPGKALIDAVVDYLRARHVLLLLDNCEHLLEPCSQLADRVIGSCPHVKVLATSREPLRTAGETTYRVPSLSLPDLHGPPTAGAVSHCESVHLFSDRARAVAPAFEVTDRNACWVAQICRRLDGIPLAIELAAARVRALSVEQITEHLDDRFHLLTGGSRMALPRQQTLRALIDWSYNLLTEEEKALLRRLSVFSGGWDLEAAQSVCSGDGLADWQVLDPLVSLVDKSLVVFEEREGAERYRLLETIRQYAREKLAGSEEAEAVRARHLDWFLQLAEQAEPQLGGARQAEWFNRLEVEIGNVRAALEWSADSERMVRLAGALWRFWYVRGHFAEGSRWLDDAIAHDTDAPAAVRAKVWSGAGTMAWLCDDYPRAEALHRQGLAFYREAGDDLGVAFSLNNLAVQAKLQGDRDRATRLYKEGLAIARAVGGKEMIATLLTGLGIMQNERADFGSAQSNMSEALDLMRELGNKDGVALLLANLGLVALYRGDESRAKASLESALTLCRQIDDRRLAAYVLCYLGRLACRQGDYPGARARLAEGLSLGRNLGYRHVIVENLEASAEVLAAEGSAERAARLIGASAALRDAIGYQIPPADRELYHNRLVAAVRSALGQTAFASTCADGRAISWEEAVACALKAISHA